MASTGNRPLSTARRPRRRRGRMGLGMSLSLRSHRVIKRQESELRTPHHPVALPSRSFESRDQQWRGSHGDDSVVAVLRSKALGLSPR